MTQDEIMEMARQAHFDSKTWVDIFADKPTVGDVRNYLIAFAKLVAAKTIAELESQEPVAWMSPNKEHLEFSRKDTVYGSHTIPLYFDRFLQNNLYSDDYEKYLEALDQLSQPTPRTWIGLTDDEFQLIYGHGRTPAGMMEMVEAKLKENKHD